MKIGITERGDAGLDVDGWEKKMPEVDGAILITKAITSPRFRLAAMRWADKSIVHATCTFLGGSPIEPNVPRASETIAAISDFIRAGFPASHLVLRLDPIIGIPQIKLFKKYATELSDLGVHRVRFSFIDFYPHVVSRFKEAEIPLPVLSPNGFTIHREKMDECLQLLDEIGIENHMTMESCGEFIFGNYRTIRPIGCVSKIDLYLLGIEEEPVLSKYTPRPACKCLPKVELLSNRTRCPHQCLYCYWKD